MLQTTATPKQDHSEISDVIEEMRTELPESPKNAVHATLLTLACQTTMLVSWSNKVTSDSFEKAVAPGGDKQV